MTVLHAMPHRDFHGQVAVEEQLHICFLAQQALHVSRMLTCHERARYREHAVRSMQGPTISSPARPVSQ